MTTESVKVIVRCRPLLDAETKTKVRNIVCVDKQVQQISLQDPKDMTTGGESLLKTFRFDEVFDQSSSQQQVYDEAAFQIVEAAVEGYNGTIFAYGQTGCGKTHTMMGRFEISKGEGQELGGEAGIMPRSFTHLFSAVRSLQQRNPAVRFLLRCSFIEIYNEDLKDLLSEGNNVRLD